MRACCDEEVRVLLNESEEVGIRPAVRLCLAAEHGRVVGATHMHRSEPVAAPGAAVTSSSTTRTNVARIGSSRITIRANIGVDNLHDLGQWTQRGIHARLPLGVFNPRVRVEDCSRRKFVGRRCFVRRDTVQCAQSIDTCHICERVKELAEPSLAGRTEPPVNNKMAASLYRHLAVG